jgi:hypothetical protein
MALAGLSVNVFLRTTLYISLEHLYCAVEAFSHAPVQDLKFTQPQALVNIFEWVFCY